MRLPVSLALCAALLVPVMRVVAQDAPATQPAAEPADFRKLKEVLPQTVLDLKRTEATGEKLKMGEFIMSQANAAYGGGDDENAPRVDISIHDYAGMKGAGDMFAAWTQMEIDSESDTGYQRTLQVQDQPAHEEYSTESKSGTLQIWVAKRYLVTVNADQVTQDQFKKLQDQFDVKKLAEVK
jgi:hypothetical protein